jgi:hypothetical protein
MRDIRGQWAFLPCANGQTFKTDSVTSTPIAETNGAMRSGMGEHSELFGVAAEISHAREGDRSGNSMERQGTRQGKAF